MNNIQKKAEEKLYLTLFLNSYTKGSAFSINQIIEQTGLNTPDAYIPEGHLLIEVKKVIDEADTARSGKWGAIVNNLQSLTNKKILTCNLHGLYSIDVPWDFNLPKIYHERVVNELFDAISNNKNSLQTHNVSFQIKKLNSTDNYLAFVAFGQVGSYDAAGSFVDHVKNILPKAEIQLGYSSKLVKPEKKILLLVNQEQLLRWKWDLYNGISKYYEFLCKSKNIDEVWIQHQGKHKTFNEMLFSKEFFNKFENKTVNAHDAGFAELFGNWFSPLSQMGEDKKPKLLDVLECYLEIEKPYKLFKDPNVRIDILKFGDWLLVHEPIEKTKWLINKFLDDPDPSKKIAHGEKAKNNLHRRVFNNEDVNVIAGVQGHLAWLVKQLATHSSITQIDNLLFSFELTKRKLNKKNQNLYIVQQWLCPLTEIANRRIWLANSDPATYKQFKKLMLDRKTGVIAKYSQYKSISRLIINILYYLKDLTTDESIYVLKKLEDSPEAASLFVYYAVYRKNHYKQGSEAGDIFGRIDSNIFIYDPKKASDLLKKIIISQNSKLKGQIAWQFWKILDDVPDEFCTLSPWIDLIFKNPYDRDLYSKLEMIIEKWYGVTTTCDNPSHKWLLSYITKITEFSDNHKSDKPLEMWLSIDVVLNKVAELHPESLINIVDKLTNIWIEGAYIGDLGVIFGSYKHLDDPKLKKVAKSTFQSNYQKMKTLNSKIMPIEFN